MQIVFYYTYCRCIGIHFLKSQEVFQNWDLLTESELILSCQDTLQTNYKFDNACNPHHFFFHQKVICTYQFRKGCVGFLSLINTLLLFNLLFNFKLVGRRGLGFFFSKIVIKTYKITSTIFPQISSPSSKSTLPWKGTHPLGQNVK